MTATTSATASGGATWKWLLPVLAAVALTVFVLPSGDGGATFDLNSATPEGYRGLRLLLEEGGTSVERIDAGEVDAAAVADHDVVFIPDGGDGSAAQVRRWRAYVEAGGRLVLGSPSESLGAPPATTDDAASSDLSFSSSVDTGDCDLDELADAGPIVPPFGASPVDLSTGADGCFTSGGLALVGRTRLGAGEVVSITSPTLFVNELMGAPAPEQPVGPIPGNAVVAERLLGHGIATESNPGGGRRLGIVTSGVDAPAVAGDETLTDFMSPGVKLGLLELGVAVAFYAVARGRRHGRVVTEAAPVDIAGAAFVEAVGSLLQRQGDAGRAADIVRDARCRDLAKGLGRPTSVSRAELVGAVAQRTGRDPEEVARLLVDPVDSDSELVSITRELDALCQEALHV